MSVQYRTNVSVFTNSFTSLPAFGLQSAVQVITSYFKNIDHRTIRLVSILLMHQFLIANAFCVQSLLLACPSEL
jgi:hypothetical protein